MDAVKEDIAAGVDTFGNTNNVSLDSIVVVKKSQAAGYFDVEKFKAAMKAKGKAVVVASPEIRLNAALWHKQLEPFRPAYRASLGKSVGSDIAREIEAVKRMSLFLSVYFFALGVKHCQLGFGQRFCNEHYVGGYGKQYEAEQKECGMMLDW